MNNALEQREKGDAELAISEAEKATFAALNAKHGSTLDAMSKADLSDRVSRFGCRLQQAYRYRPTSPIVRFELLRQLASEAISK
jgi:hypothetical protein